MHPKYTRKSDRICGANLMITDFAVLDDDIP